METIAKKNNLSKEQAVQYFLEMIKDSDCINEYLIYDIADALDLPREELLNGKQMQLQTLHSLNKYKMSMKSSDSFSFFNGIGLCHLKSVA